MFSVSVPTNHKTLFKKHSKSNRIATLVQFNFWHDKISTKQRKSGNCDPHRPMFCVPHTHNIHILRNMKAGCQNRVSLHCHVRCCLSEALSYVFFFEFSLLYYFSVTIYVSISVIANSVFKVLVLDWYWLAIVHKYTQHTYT